jgi:hypothetical protein
VKGYTTVVSSYPLRNIHYGNVPTKDARKALPFRDYVQANSIDYYNRGGLSVSLKP